MKRFPGLYASSNPNRPPEGATDVDQETVRRSLDVAEPRRGYKASAAAGGPINAIAFKQSQVVALTYDTPSNTGALRLYSPATDAWSALPMNPGALTVDRPAIAGAHTRFVSAQKALYFQGKYGLLKVEDVATGVCRPAAQPRSWTSRWGGAGSNATIGGPGGTYLLTGNQTAYRFTICRKGANGELIESQPTDRLVVPNTSGGTRDVLVTPQTSWMLAPDVFYRIYRAKQVPIGGPPSDEMFLVAETLPGGPGFGVGPDGFLIPATGAGYTDNTPDGSLYAPLYTNPQSGLGFGETNTPAPLGADTTWFKNRLYNLNTLDVQRLTIKVIGTGAGGIQDGDSFTLAGVTFRFRNPLPAIGTANLVYVATAGTVTQNLEDTATFLVAAINTYFSGSVFYTPVDTGPLPGKIVASYISTGAQDAGQILLERVVPGAQPFTFSTSSRNGWDKDYTVGTASDPNAQVSGIAWSSFNQPEANPTNNNDPIGDPTASGQRLIALKDTLFAFKQDGLWANTDDGSVLGPSTRLVDPTIRLVAPETAVALDNMIFALCDQGAILISETGGVANISHEQIERELFKLMAYVGAAKLAELAFGVAYLPEHTYVLALPESPNATSCTKQYVFNLQSRAWTSWAIPGGVLCGAVHPDTGQLYFGRPDGTLAIERKDFASTDYQDPGFTIASPTAALTRTLVFSGDLRTGTTPFAVGDIVQQFQATNVLAQRVISVSYSSSLNQTTVTLDAVPRYAWNQVALLTVVKAIQAQIRFLPFHADQPLTGKDWGDCYLSFRYCDLDFLSVGFASETSPLTDTAAERVNNADGSSAPITLDAWGSGAWGSKVWGRQARDLVLKATLPQKKVGYASQLTPTLSMPCALNRFELSAIDIKIAGETDKEVR